VFRPARALALIALLGAASAGPRSAHASAAELLLAQAEAHAARGEMPLAVRRFMEALDLDVRLVSAYLGLGALRERTGDLAEAERVYSVALSYVPRLVPALLGRARVRHQLGREELAMADIAAAAAESGDAALEEATWHRASGHWAQELAVWRMFAARGDRTAAEATRRARATARALEMLLDSADPVTRPPREDFVRSSLARLSRPSPPTHAAAAPLRVSSGARSGARAPDGQALPKVRR
jgi:tetratricopeptide (TPR) repeat protein